MKRMSLMMAAIVLIASSVAGGFWGSRLVLQPPQVSSVSAAPAEEVASLPMAQTAAGSYIFSYPAKFVCMEPIQPGTLWYGTSTPLVKEATGVLVHNPQPYPVRIYKKAVQARLEDASPINPGKWVSVTLQADHAIRIDCDDIAKLLTGNPAATFIGTYGIGVEVEGFVVIGVGPQFIAGTNVPKYGQVDVTAEYVRGSEVLKKDIGYQPWWWWWWWPLPWRLGYAYQRVITLSPTMVNIDCRQMLYDELKNDVARSTMTDTLKNLTNMALDAGASVDPTSVMSQSAESPPALVALVGRCDKVPLGTGLGMSVDYVLVSNKTSTDPDPRNPTGTAIVYPWIPGRWYDLTVVMPQNVNKDLDKYIRDWNTQRWIDANPTAPDATIRAAMTYYFPYWCGWGYWWWWWNGGSCIDIGVGEGESLDVEQVVGTRVFMPVWPPVNQPGQ